MIKPEFWDDAEISEVSLEANLLFIGMWNFADDKGIIEADASYIKSKVFPRREDLRKAQVIQWIDQLKKARFLVPLKYKEKSYYVIRTFGVHQKIDKPRPSKIPENIVSEALRLFDEDSTTIRRTIDEGSTTKIEIEEEREDEDEDEGEENDETSSTPPVTFGETIIRNIKDLRDGCLQDQVYFVEHICRQHKITPEEVPKRLDEFNEHLTHLQTTMKTIKDYRVHFGNWLRKRSGIPKNNPPATGTPIKRADTSKYDR